jgi:hypothetical protein
MLSGIWTLAEIRRDGWRLLEEGMNSTSGPLSGMASQPWSCQAKRPGLIPIPDFPMSVAGSKKSHRHGEKVFDNPRDQALSFYPLFKYHTKNGILSIEPVAKYIAKCVCPGASFCWSSNITFYNIGKIIFPGDTMSKAGNANGSSFGHFISDQLLRRRPHFLFDLSRAVDFSLVNAALPKGRR